MRWLRSWRILVLLLFLAVVIVMVWARFAPPPPTLGVSGDQLAPCGSRPNCVSSQASDGEHAIAPLPRTGTATESLDRLAAIIEALPRTRIVTRTDSYLHAEFKSRLFGFVDDVEFYAPEGDEVVHFRSASRLGYSDLGANRARMEDIRAKYEAS